jgi:hypothetical protein
VTTSRYRTREESRSPTRSQSRAAAFRSALCPLHLRQPKRFGDIRQPHTAGAARPTMTRPRAANSGLPPGWAPGSFRSTRSGGPAVGPPLRAGGITDVFTRHVAFSDRAVCSIRFASREHHSRPRSRGRRRTAAGLAHKAAAFVPRDPQRR